MLFSEDKTIVKIETIHKYSNNNPKLVPRLQISEYLYDGILPDDPNRLNGFRQRVNL